MASYGREMLCLQYAGFLVWCCPKANKYLDLFFEILSFCVCVNFFSGAVFVYFVYQFHLLNLSKIHIFIGFRENQKLSNSIAVNSRLGWNLPYKLSSVILLWSSLFFTFMGFFLQTNAPTLNSNFLYILSNNQWPCNDLTTNAIIYQ